MSDYGDTEPEDAYDAGDPGDVIARNIARRLELLAVNLAARGNRPTPRDLLRLAHAVADLGALADRFRDE